MGQTDPAASVRSLVAPLLDDLGLELFDVELKGGILRVSVDRDGGVDLEAISRASQRVSDLLDEADLIKERYTLEVSSPGLERTLRTPAHFRRYVGTKVSVKTRPDVEGERRFEGVLEEADEDGVAVGGRRLSYDDLDRVRTVFEWGGQPKKQPAKHAKPPKKKAAS